MSFHPKGIAFNASTTSLAIPLAKPNADQKSETNTKKNPKKTAKRSAADDEILWQLALKH